VLVSAATIIRTEKRLPAATAESEKDCLISGKAMPRVATIMDGIRLAQGMMKILKRSRAEGAAESRSVIGWSYLSGIIT
jgi:hypothetical protein